jgi:LPS export ABC transporter protein LptC
MWRWAVFLLITLGLVSAFYWQSSAQSEHSTASTRAEKTQKLTQFRAFELDNQGHVKSELRGESWTQATDKTSYILQPEYSLTAETRQVFIRADRASQAKDEDIIHLEGQVNVTQQTPSDTLHLFTSDLDYNQTQATLTTQSSIVIQSSFGELKGKGLSAWLNEEKIQIHSGVKGIYVEH